MYSERDEGHLDDSRSEAWRRTLKEVGGQVCDFSEKLFARLLDEGQRLIAVFEQTPIYPVLELQQAFTRKAVEYHLRIARYMLEAL